MDPTHGSARDTAGPAHHPEVDWEAVERSPEFRELVASRRRFVLPATLFFLTWYFGFIILAGYAEDFMSESVYQGVTVGYLLALTQFLMVAVLGLWYLRRAERVFDPLQRRAVEKAAATQGGADRFRRTSGTGTPEAPPPAREVPR